MESSANVRALVSGFKTASKFVPLTGGSKRLAGRLHMLYYRWGLMLFAQVCGFEVAAAVARRAGRFLWENIPSVRDGARAAAANALGDSLTPEQIESAAFACVEDFGVPFLESEFIDRLLTRCTWSRRIRLLDGEPLFAAIHQGRGVIAVGPAVGNYEVALAAMGFALDGKVTAIVSPWQFSSSQRAMAGLVRRGLATLCPRENAIEGAVAALREGRLLMMIGERERRSDTHNVPVPFLGRTAQFYPTPALLAWRTRCPIAVVSCCRSAEPFSFEGQLHDWIEPPATGRKEWIIEATRRIASSLDAIIRTHPAEYRWVTPFLRAGW